MRELFEPSILYAMHACTKAKEEVQRKKEAKIKASNEIYK